MSENKPFSPAVYGVRHIKRQSFSPPVQGHSYTERDTHKHIKGYKNSSLFLPYHTNLEFFHNDIKKKIHS